MIDFHTHILPGIDDGSRDIQMTKDLLLLQKEQGVERIVFTPHFYAQHENAQHFLDKRQRAYEQTLKMCEEEGLDFEFKLGAEVYYFPGMGGASILPDLGVEGTNYLMVEMPFAQWTREVYKDIRDIISTRGIGVILVHVERFYPFQKNKDVWEDIFRLPVIPQINTGSFLAWSSRRFDLKFMKSGHGVILGSDCHNTESRTPNLLEGRNIIQKKLGDEMLKEIDERGKKLWDNDQI